MRYPVKNIGLNNFQWVTLVLQTELPSHSKMLAMYLSTFMNIDQDIAWPSLSRITKQLSISRSTACKHLDILEGEGWILRDRGNQKKNTRYIIGFPKQLETVISSASERLGSPSGVLGSPSGVLDVVRHTDTNNTLNNTVNNKDYVSTAVDTPRANGKDFERFWEHWPIKRNKAKAKAAFVRKQFEITDVDELIADVQDRVKHDPQWKKGFIPHCSTYINGERWEDSFDGNKA